MSARTRCRPPALYLAAALVAIGMTGCSQTRNVATTQNSDVAVAEPADSDADIEALFWERQQQARTLYVQADVDFMTGMIGHHAQALVMSALAPKNGASPEVQRLAARIINAQNDEIATMQGWLRDRGEKVPEVHISGTELMVHGAGDHAMHMPGMLSAEQLKELEAARGVEFDRLFLTYMIQHHGGAVSMVKDLFATDGAGQDEASFKLANDINVDQITEIKRMELMLNALPEASREP